MTSRKKLGVAFWATGGLVAVLVLAFLLSDGPIIYNAIRWLDNLFE